MSRLEFQQTPQASLRRFAPPGLYVGARQFEQGVAAQGAAFGKESGAFERGNGRARIALRQQATTQLEPFTGIGCRCVSLAGSFSHKLAEESPKHADAIEVPRGSGQGRLVY